MGTASFPGRSSSRYSPPSCFLLLTFSSRFVAFFPGRSSSSYIPPSCFLLLTFASRFLVFFLFVSDKLQQVLFLFSLYFPPYFLPLYYLVSIPHLFFFLLFHFLFLSLFLSQVCFSLTVFALSREVPSFFLTVLFCFSVGISPTFFQPAQVRLVILSFYISFLSFFSFSFRIFP